MKDMSFAGTKFVVLWGSFMFRLIPCLNEATEDADFRSLGRSFHARIVKGQIGLRERFV